LETGVVRAIGDTFRPRRFTATCEQRVWYLFTPTGVAVEIEVYGDKEPFHLHHLLLTT
jgi:hypothetical protein